MPLALIVLSWLSSYAFVLLEALANGAREPPVLAAEMLNPLNEWRAIFQLIVLIVLAGVLAGLWWRVNAPLAIALAVAAFIALPASTGALAVSSSVWQSVHPLVLWHIVRALGVSYLVIVACMLGYGALIAWLQHGALLPDWAINAICLFAWLSVFALIGGTLFEHRIALGHEAIDLAYPRSTGTKIRASLCCTSSAT